MGYLSEKAAYLKGLAEGLNVDENKSEGKLLVKIIEALEEFAATIEDNSDAVEACEERVDELEDFADDLMEGFSECCGDDHEGCDCCDCDDEDYDDEEFYEVECPHCNEHSLTGSTVHIAMNGEYMGHIVISDEIKENAAETVKELKALGIPTVMMSGDNQKTTERIAKQLNIDEYYAALLPDGKVTLAEKFMSKKGINEIACFVGDGINDAPVLMRADIGISMGAMGSDAAIEAADIVIMDDDISKVKLAHKIAKRTLGIVSQNIVFFIMVKSIVLTLSAFGYAPMWLAIFADVGVTIIEILNSTRAMRVIKK